ncbi:metallophosphoesterase [Mesorhizobium sp. WSM2561]|uniref:metallophosphoesterase n=1 Tax=Mesorhizobium sp. WSM2561 TaxID=1040985 RepID=UPI0004B4CA39|nr:metallophosphoesterase [Mesorhizobium sp. WSM2561]
MRKVFIISDLHLGGTYPVSGEAGDRGFRLCTHADTIVHFVDQLAKEMVEKGPYELVLNGDTVDFLAERDGDANAWSPFTSDPQLAVDKFNAIAARDPQVFASFGRFLAVGGRLTVLLGNHDIELSLPPVRAALRQALGVQPSHNFEFVQDGEAYVIGDALIEHGNRYDSWNQIDLDALRRVRSLISRRQAVPKQYEFAPPPGSLLVTSVMNEIKLKYPFIDLLKPEISAAVPILLALEPSYRKRFGNVARLWYWTRSHGLEGPALPKFGGDINAPVQPDQPFGHSIGATGESVGIGSAQSLLGALNEEEALKGVIRDALGNDSTNFLRQIDDDSKLKAVRSVAGMDVGVRETLDKALGVFDLVLGSESARLETRLGALLKAIRGLQKEDTFNESVETLTEYLNAARELTKGGFRYVVFGHTHQAKCIELDTGRWYLNSGTWADVLRFPIEILASPEAEALSALRNFIDELKRGDFTRWTLFRPTYVRLDVDDAGNVTAAELCTVPTAVP